jgi:uncharacterized protein YutD
MTTEMKDISKTIAELQRELDRIYNEYGYYYCKYTGRYWTKDKMIFEDNKPLCSDCGATLYDDAIFEISTLESDIAEKRANGEETIYYAKEIDEINAHMDDYIFLLCRYGKDCADFIAEHSFDETTLRHNIFN